MAIQAIDLFCGVGGLTHGLALSGIKVVAGLDLDPSCRYPYEENNDARFVKSDIRDVRAQDLNEIFDSCDGIRLLAGCAPCQPFSTYSRSQKSAPRGSDWSLVATFGRLIKDTQPDLVTMENVPSLAQHPVFTEFLGCLRNYHVSWSIVDCSKVGVPQTRKRLVLLASKFGGFGLTIANDVDTEITVKDTIGNLPKLSAGQRDTCDPLHVACRLSPKNLERIRASLPGGTWRDWKSHLRADCHSKSSGETYPSVYGRMAWDALAPTITTQSFGFGNGRFGHPDQDRAISLREAAMLQTFPPNYIFAKPGERIKFSSLGRVIGNAVPVKLGEAIGKALVSHVQKYSATPA